MKYKIIGHKRWVVLLSAMIVLLLSTAVMSESSVVTEGSKAAGMDSCIIESTEMMRRNHMEYLKHDRIDTVRNGVPGRRQMVVQSIR